MRYIIDIPEGIHRKIVQLIADGNYSTLQDFALTAFQNQILIEGISKQEADEISEFRLGELPVSEIDIVNYKLSSISSISIEPIPSKDNLRMDEWIFGQINRILPIKFGLRILLVLLQDSGKWISLDWFHERASQEARRFGKYLQNQDEIHKRSRSNKYSVGFPIGQLSKSSKRYGSQFLGFNQHTTGHPFGALPSLKFAAIVEEADGEYSIGVTKGGLEFGLISNPVIDEDNSDQTISSNEAQYYIHHVRTHASNEADAIFTILTLINGGFDNTQKIDLELSNKFPNWSKSQIATNRSGIIGRMKDLGLINKEHEKLAVRYLLTTLGKQSLDVLSQS